MSMESEFMHNRVNDWPTTAQTQPHKYEDLKWYQ